MRGGVAISCGLLASVGVSLAGTPSGGVRYSGADEHAFAELVGRAEVREGGAVTLMTPWTFALTVEAEVGVEVGEVDADVLLGPGMLVSSVDGPEAAEREGGGETLTWTIAASPGAVGAVDLGEPAIRYSVFDASRGGARERTLRLERAAPSAVGVGAVPALLGEAVTADSEAAGQRGAVGGRWLSVVLWGVAIGVAGLAGLVAIGWVLVRLVRRVVERGEARRRAPDLPRPPHEVALERLDALQRSELFERGEYERVAVEACDVARVYIGDRFGLRAPRMTTREFLGAAERSAVLGGKAGLLRSLLSRADRIKFAGEDATADDAERALVSVRAFVIETARPIDAPGREHGGVGDRPAWRDNDWASGGGGVAGAPEERAER